MKIDWKTLSLATITSIIVTWISGLILSISNIIQTYPNFLYSLSQYVYDDLDNLSKYYDNKVSITIAEAGYGPPYYLPLWAWITISLICMAVLTLVFYFVIGHLRKRKK